VFGLTRFYRPPGLALWGNLRDAQRGQPATGIGLNKIVFSSVFYDETQKLARKEPEKSKKIEIAVPRPLSSAYYYVITTQLKKEKPFRDPFRLHSVRVILDEFHCPARLALWRHLRDA